MTCPICLIDLPLEATPCLQTNVAADTPPSAVVFLPCHHGFHAVCHDLWLAHGPAQCCPLCRAPSESGGERSVCMERSRHPRYRWLQEWVAAFPWLADARMAAMLAQMGDGEDETWCPWKRCATCGQAACRLTDGRLLPPESTAAAACPFVPAELRCETCVKKTWPPFSRPK